MRCSFWSSKAEKVECYGECPMFKGDNGELNKDSQCIFNECSSESDFNLKDIINRDYSYFKSYDEEKSIGINF